MQQTHARVLKGGDGRLAMLGGFGIRWMIPGTDSNGRFSLVEHPLKPRALAAPLHRHSREDEFSFILEGRVGALLGEEVVYGGAGDVIWKPRDQWHTFWNAGDEPCRILEIISPAGFEQFFRELSDLGGAMAADPDEFARLRERYGLEMRPESMPDLVQRFGLRVGERLSGGWVPA